LQAKYPALEVVLAYGELQDEHGDKIIFEIVEG